MQQAPRGVGVQLTDGQVVPGGRGMPPIARQRSTEISTHVMFGRQQAPGGEDGGGQAMLGSKQEVPLPWYMPPKASQRAGRVSTQRGRPGWLKQQAPTGAFGWQVVAAQELNGPCGTPPWAWHSVGVISTQVIFGKQQAVTGGGGAVQGIFGS